MAIIGILESFCLNCVFVKIQETQKNVRTKFHPLGPKVENKTLNFLNY